MFENVKINEVETERKFGYKISDIPFGSHKKVIVECVGCHTLITREYRNVGRKHQCPISNGSEKRCFKCGEWKDLSKFNKSCNRIGGYSKLCRQCYNSYPSVKRCEQKRKYRIQNSFENDIELYMKKRVYNLKYHCKKNQIPCDLDSKFLLDLWNKQNAKCFYSGILLLRKVKQEGFQAWDSPSLDRKDPSLGYVKTNVVWAAFGVNSFKQTLNEQEFENIIKQISWWYSFKT